MFQWRIARFTGGRDRSNARGEFGCVEAATPRRNLNELVGLERGWVYLGVCFEQSIQADCPRVGNLPQGVTTFNDIGHGHPVGAIGANALEDFVVRTCARDTKLFASNDQVGVHLGIGSNDDIDSHVVFGSNGSQPIACFDRVIKRRFVARPRGNTGVDNGCGRGSRNGRRRLFDGSRRFFRTETATEIKNEGKGQYQQNGYSSVLADQHGSWSRCLSQ